MLKDYLRDGAPILYDRKYINEKGKIVSEQFRLVDIRKDDNPDAPYMTEVFSLTTQKIWRKPIYRLPDGKFIMYMDTRGGPYYEVFPDKLLVQLRDSFRKFADEFIHNVENIINE